MQVASCKIVLRDSIDFLTGDGGKSLFLREMLLLMDIAVRYRHTRSKNNVYMSEFNECVKTHYLKKIKRPNFYFKNLTLASRI